MALEIGQDFQQTVGNPTKCNDNIKYWLPIKLEGYSEGHYHWSGDQYFDSNYNVKNINWTTSQPNSYGNEKCAGVTQISGKYFANDISCDSPRCAVCNIPVVNSFYLRGPGPEGLAYQHRKGLTNIIDRKYSLLLELQKNTSQLIFVGQTGLSQITWFLSKKILAVKRYDNADLQPGKKSLNLNYIVQPFGQYPWLHWSFTNVSSMNRKYGVFHTFSMESSKGHLFFPVSSS